MSGLRLGTRCFLIGALWLAAGCQALDETYFEDQDALPVDGKADLLADLTKLALGDTVTGTLAPAGKPGDRHLFVMALKKGDRFRLTMKATGTSLSPDFGLYTAGGSPISSSKWSKPTSKTLVKEYLTTSAGNFIVLVRAYKGQGSGGYSLAAACLGGPCKGEYPPTTLDLDEAAECIDRARTCSVAQMKAKATKLTVTQSTTLFNTCLAQVSLSDGSSCKTACAFKDTDSYSKDAAAELCKSIIDGLAFYSGQPAACLSSFGDCWDACTSIGGNNTSADSFADTTPYVCLAGGFNGNCDSYARAHANCGGKEYSEGTWKQCCALVSSSDGAWTDDMDTMCQDSCDDEYCEAEVARCKAGCPGGTQTCIDTCLENDGIWGCN